MIALYITSPEKGSGKTAICAGLGKQLLARGKKTGFFKPVITDTGTATPNKDSDTEFIKHLFALSEPADLLCPLIHDGSNRADSIKEAHARVSQGKHVVIIEGTADQYQSAPEIAKVLDARVIIVETYSRELLKGIDSYGDFGNSLLGIVLNKVPNTRLEQARAEASARLGQAGINLLGVLPEDRTLFTMTISELADSIHGEILHGDGKSAELVENLMLGALALDPGPDYFSRKANKAVVLKSERADMQLAALETSSRCLVLAGGTPPNKAVLNRAKRKNIPVISARDDVNTLVDKIENALVNGKFNQDNKLSRVTEIIEQHLDFQAVYQGLGLGGE
ncbi:DRTGG domain-containing protein [Chloroflexota bacterium]